MLTVGVDLLIAVFLFIQLPGFVLLATIIIILTTKWIHQRIIKYLGKLYWHEWLVLLSFSTILAIDLVFLMMLATASLNPTPYLTPLTLLLGALFLVLLIYPPIEFLYFAGKGQQATEFYHETLEHVIDLIASKLPHHRLGGILAYLAIFPLPILLLITILKMPPVTAIFWWSLLYPVFILAYYGALGMVDALRPALYLREYSKDFWLTLLLLLGSLVSVLTFFFDLSFLTIADTFVQFVNKGTGMQITIPETLKKLLLLLPILFVIVLTVRGFHSKYWTNKPKTRQFDYLFSAYLSVGMTCLILIGLLEKKDFHHVITLISNPLMINFARFSHSFKAITTLQNIAILTWILIEILGGWLLTPSVVHAFLLEYLYKDVGTPDSSGKKVTPFFDPLTSLKHLKTLKMSNVKMTAIPLSLLQLKRLEELDLSSNNLNSDLPALERFFTTLERAEWHKHVKILNLSHNRLERIPENISILTNLQTLYLYENQLQSLPETFGQLSSLQHLELQYNKLKSLPDTFGNLSRLEYLNLGENQLESLPDTFGRLSRLECLVLSWNQLKSLPDTLTQITGLKTLFLWGNPSLTLSSTLQQWIERLRDNGCNVRLL